METSSHTARRIGGAAGLGAAVLLLVQFVMVGAPPENDAPVAEIQKFLLDNRTGGLASVVLGALVVPLFIVFGAALWDAVAERVGNGLTAGALLGGALFMLLELLAATLFFGIAWIDGAAEGLGTDVVQVGWNIVNVTFAVAGPLATLFLVVVGIAQLRQGTAKWTAWVAFLAAAVLLVGTLGAVFPALLGLNFLGSILLALWILVTGIRLLRGSFDDPPAETATTRP